MAMIESDDDSDDALIDPRDVLVDILSHEQRLALLQSEEKGVDAVDALAEILWPEWDDYLKVGPMPLFPWFLDADTVI